MPDVSEHTVKKAVNLILARMSGAMMHGQHIEIRGFGSFSIRKMSERGSHNPKTGEQLRIEPKNKIYFKPGLEFRQRLIESRESVAIKEEA